MDIKKKTTILLVVSCIYLLISMSTLSFSGTSQINKGLKNSLTQNLQVQSFEDTVVDKIYNLTVERPYVKFNNNIAFEKKFTYYITVCVVTPHTCTLNITLWDPECTEFQLSYEEEIGQNDYREIPFGVAIEGNYTIHFIAVDLMENINIHINIEREHLALYDKIDSFEQGDIIHYNVSKFYDGMLLNHTLVLKSDWYYKLYFGRVSPISKLVNNNVTLVHYIIDDTQGIPFIMYINNSLASPKEVSKYGFSTAIGGEYTVLITIHCNVTAINLAYAIVELQKSSDGIDPNEPAPPPEPLPDNKTIPNNNTMDGITTTIPTEWTIGIIVFTGVLVGVPILVVLSRKKKNVTGI